MTAWLLMLLLMMCIAVPAANAAETKPIQLFLNGKQLNPEVAPRIVNGNTIVPVRIIAESAGAKVSWDEKQRKVTVLQGEQTVQLFIDKTTAYVNGKSYTLEAAPVIVDGSTLLPLRFVVEQLNTKVTWDEITRSVFMYNQSTLAGAGTNGGGAQGEVVVDAKPEQPVGQSAGQPDGEAQGEKTTGSGKTDGTDKPTGVNNSTGASNKPGGTEQSSGEAAAPQASGQPTTGASQPGQAGQQPNAGQAEQGGEKKVDSGTADKPQQPASPSVEPQIANVIYDLAFAGEQLVVRTTTEAPLKPKVFRLSNPDRVVIDVPGVKLHEPLAAQAAGQASGAVIEATNSAFASQIRYSQFTEEAVRIVIDLTNGSRYKLAVAAEGAKQLVLQLEPPRERAVVYLDPGHGGKDSGAISKHTGRYEKTFVLALSRKVTALLEKEKGIEVRTTRSDDTFLELAERVALANYNDADAFISIHANASDKASVSGTETFYYTEHSLSFANIMHSYIIQATGFIDRKVKQGNFHVLRNTSMPSVLLEIGFLSNKQEESLLFQESLQNQVAAAIVQGIKKQLNLE
ncbi:N-acetylmuramoyl-L-alanine amidase [Paenibacillus sp. YYML68]|uniref:N-acetylmuramoyl-L-alanine amidase n=1 Tax=Paenibacillus sp. YYML68 TaxID=2909250 RepID=UPI002492280E|nr:N-acetylmuramoyl-L-alanine amidase [Paenibacillus sp. YYML68]